MTTHAITTEDRLRQLKEILQGEVKAARFEELTAALFSALLGIAIAVAKSGFQHGADAGTGGRQGRRLRIETKRYADTTALSDRELLGEVDHALRADPALEAWMLVATRAAPEQLENDLMRKSDDFGLPIIIIDWKPDTFPALAALCTSRPEILETYGLPVAAVLARELAVEARPYLDRLTADIQSWNLGFERLRDQSVQRLLNIWTTPRASAAALGQNAAGGALSTTIQRPAPTVALNAWWHGRAREDAPVIIAGSQGVGKTWATLQWAVGKIDELPIVLIVPSTAVASFGSVSSLVLKRFIGGLLYELTQARDPEHWFRRLDRLLNRPKTEGPLILLVFDGMNQEPAAPWLNILKGLQDPEFEGLIRVAAVTRKLFLKDRLSNLRGLVVPPDIVAIDIFDASPGGEFDQRLAAEGLSRKDLHEDLLEIAKTPRLFNLVLRLRKQLADAEHVTVHRLLWEYGKDTIGVRDGAPFSESDWREWLAEVAQRRLAGVASYSLKHLSDMVSRTDLNPSEVSRRLSEIIDTDFTGAGGTANFELSPMLTAHALGAALLEHLKDEREQDWEHIENRLFTWLDPIAALDEKAEILRAAVSIFLETETTPSQVILEVLVFEWLRSQNIPENHQSELRRIAAPLCGPLLQVIERADYTALGSARAMALNALRSISRDDLEVLAQIVIRMADWLKVISRDVDPPQRRHADSEAARQRRLLERVGFDEDGERTVLGHTLIFVENRGRWHEETIPSLLDGFPLQSALPVFERAALALAIRNRESFWEGLKWICLLNERDFSETCDALKQRADEILSLTPEAGVAPTLAARVSALLLWLSGEPSNETKAADINPRHSKDPTYDADYLADPSNSFFGLERRHAALLLSNKGLALRRRIERASKFLLDPAFEPPADFCVELREAAAGFDILKLDVNKFVTPDDHLWETLVPALARCAPDLLATLGRRKFATLPQREEESRYFAGIHSTREYLLIDDTARKAAQALRLAGRCTEENEESFVSSRLLSIELDGLASLDMFRRIIDADLKYLYWEMDPLLSNLSAEEADTLITEYGAGSPKQKLDLIRLLAMTTSKLSNTGWDWLEQLTFSPDFEEDGLGFRVLQTSDGLRFGRLLLQRGWHWAPDKDADCNHFGSLALAEASKGLPFDQHAPAIAPWLLPHAVSVRGSGAADVETAAAILNAAVSGAEMQAPDVGSDISVTLQTRKKYPFSLTVITRPETHANPTEQLKNLLDTEKKEQARQRGLDTAIDRIKAAKAAGANLYLHDVQPRDLTPFVRQTPNVVARWIEGHDTLSLDFRRRVLLAEGFYLALCECLLLNDPAVGSVLWRALRKVITTRFVGQADTDDLVHMVFRVKAGTDDLRNEVAGLTYANTDRQLLDLYLAADANGEIAWLQAFVEADQSSGVVWRQRRAIKLGGFMGGKGDNAVPRWPEGQCYLQESRVRDADEWSRDQIFFRHWARAFWDAPSDDEAFVAWELLVRVADRRSLIEWEKLRPARTYTQDDPYTRRAMHAELNFDALKSAVSKAERGMDREFLGMGTFVGVTPWTS